VTTLDADALRGFVEELVAASGEVIRRHFRRPGLRVESKSDSSPVTVADREAEAVLRARIAARFPDHGIIGEEHGSEREEAEHVWILDPIDGTISFVGGVTLFGTLIGLLRGGLPILGAIHQPVTGELVIGTATGTTLDGRPVRVREPRPLGQATVLTTDPGLIPRSEDFERFENLRRRARVFRTWGDCYGYLMVATGRADLMLDPVMNPWDLLPLVPVIRGAGGRITTWEGGDPVTGSSALAGTPAAHAEALRILAGAV